MKQLFKYNFQASALTDVGQRRSMNQDVVIARPDIGFFAVSDGMGGLPDNGGGVTADIIRQVLPLMAESIIAPYESNPTAENAARLLCEQVCVLSDNIYNKGNSNGVTRFGATVACLWLVGEHAVFVSLGDSRGYLLRRFKKHIAQVTEDHNVAALLVKEGELSRKEAVGHPSASQLYQFVGMPAPSQPFTAVREVGKGDRLLLCSDGLHGMLPEETLPRLLRSSRRNPDTVCQRLVNAANELGGKDNISAVYVKITK
jgi:serine/threonine protein phosphatase PrpC